LHGPAHRYADGTPPDGYRANVQGPFSRSVSSLEWNFSTPQSGSVEEQLIVGDWWWTYWLASTGVRTWWGGISFAVGGIVIDPSGNLGSSGRWELFSSSDVNSHPNSVPHRVRPVVELNRNVELIQGPPGGPHSIHNHNP